MGAGVGTGLEKALSASSADDLSGVCKDLSAESKEKLLAALKAVADAPAAKIQFGHIAREWRMKYAENGLKGGAVELDKMLKDKHLAEIKKIDGFVSIQRAVCGGCNDFKLVVTLKADKFGDWEGKTFSPEAAFLEDAKKVTGVTSVETQKYTIEALDGSKALEEQVKEQGPGGGDQIEFSHIAREWRMKYAEGGLQGGAVALDKMLKDKYLAEIQKIDGFVSIQRVVCGACNDFKVVIKLQKEKFGAWEAKEFVPQKAFLEEAAKVSGVSSVESQALTFDIL